MKKIENKGYGLIGIKLELSFQELVILKGRAEVLNRLSAEFHGDSGKSIEANTVLLDVYAFIVKITKDVQSLSEAEAELFAPEDANIAVSDQQPLT